MDNYGNQGYEYDYEEVPRHRPPPPAAAAAPSSTTTILLVGLALGVLLILLYALSQRKETSPEIQAPAPIAPAAPTTAPLPPPAAATPLGPALTFRPAAGGPVGVPVGTLVSSLLAARPAQGQMPTTTTTTAAAAATIQSPSPSADVQTVIRYILARGTTLDKQLLSEDMKTALANPTRWQPEAGTGYTTYFYAAGLNTPSAYQLYYDTSANAWNIRVKV